MTGERRGSYKAFREGAGEGKAGPDAGKILDVAVPGISVPWI